MLGDNRTQSANVIGVIVSQNDSENIRRRPSFIEPIHYWTTFAADIDEDQPSVRKCNNGAITLPNVPKIDLHASGLS